MREKNFELTIKAAFIGYVVQAIVNNFLPLLFIQLQNEFSIPLSHSLDVVLQDLQLEFSGLELLVWHPLA